MGAHLTRWCRACAEKSERRLTCPHVYTLKTRCCCISVTFDTTSAFLLSRLELQGLLRAQSVLDSPNDHALLATCSVYKHIVQASLGCDNAPCTEVMGCPQKAATQIALAPPQTIAEKL